MDLHAKARTVESWGLQEEQKGCPMSETTRSCQLCETPLQGIAEPLAMARSLSENMSKGENSAQTEDEGTKIVRNSRWNTRVRGKGGNTSFWSMYPHCSPMEDPTLQQVNMSWEKWQPMENPCWSRGKGWGVAEKNCHDCKPQFPIASAMLGRVRRGQGAGNGGMMLNLGKRGMDEVSFWFSMSTYFLIGNKLN